MSVVTSTSKEVAMARIPQQAIKLVTERVVKYERLIHASYVEAVTTLASHLMADIPHEELWVLAINNALEVKAAIKVSQGGIASCAIVPSDVFRAVLATGCPAFFLAHNHPSGDSTPSADDIATTRRLLQGCKLLGIQMLDHLVVSDRGSASIRDLAGSGW